MKTRKELTQDILDAKEKMTWRDISAHLYPKADPNRMGALLNKIVKHPEYQPSRKVCDRLGMAYMMPTQVCLTCGIVHIGKCPSQRKQPRDLFSMSVAELRWRLEHREVV